MFRTLSVYISIGPISNIAPRALPAMQKGTHSLSFDDVSVKALSAFDDKSRNERPRWLPQNQPSRDTRMLEKLDKKMAMMAENTASSTQNDKTSAAAMCRQTEGSGIEKNMTAERGREQKEEGDQEDRGGSMNVLKETICKGVGGDVERQKVLVLTGPTAVGKTKISIELARRLNGEIISADSVQVYKGLDIGSDKISWSERQGIPHHLIDVLLPGDDFSAGDFYVRARAATEDVLSRGKVPIVVGGTGFYLRWYTMGKPSTPAATKDSETAATKALEDKWSAAEKEVGRPLDNNEKWHEGVSLVESLGDMESAQRLKSERGNMYRLIRVVDILLQSPGKTLADLDLDTSAAREYDFRCFYLNRPRMELYRRIDERVEEMLRSGLLTETHRELMAKGLTAGTNCATRAIGYRQALEFLQNIVDITPYSETTYKSEDIVTDNDIIQQLVQKMQSASRQLCHRQMSWFRDEKQFVWIEANRNFHDVVAEILELWNKPEHPEGDGRSSRLSQEEQQEMKRYVPQMKYFVRGSIDLLDLRSEIDNILHEQNNCGCKRKKDA